MDLVLVGPQGSGKGTQGKIIAENHHYTVFDTGRALRAMVENKTPLGDKIEQIMNRGELVPSAVIMEVLEAFLQDAQNSAEKILFDGVPRSAEQKELFDALLQKYNRQYRVIYLDIPRETTLQRLKKRAEIEGRSDDTEAGIQQRLTVFEQETKPLLEDWDQSGLLHSVDGLGEISAVNQRLIACL